MENKQVSPYEHAVQLKKAGNFYLLEGQFLVPGAFEPDYNIQVETTTIAATNRKLKGEWKVEVDTSHLSRLFNPSKRGKTKCCRTLHMK